MKSGGAPNLNAVQEDRGASAPQILDYLIDTAIKAEASDLHMAPNYQFDENQKYLIRVRVSGKLKTIKSSFINNNYKEVVSRLKILAKIDTTDVGEPQDGMIKIEYNGEEITLRVSVVPGTEDDEVCIRFQRDSDHLYSLDQILMTDKMSNQVLDIAKQKSGLIILNGPAGSGKTTTIYALLSHLSGPERKIITAEDPIEARLPYVSHIQVTEKSGFAELSRSFMRQDAEIIFIGEIRDKKSAQATLQLAQTGHLVLSTLHTRDSIGVISRLESLEVDQQFVADSLVASLSQRLVPALCDSCKVPIEPNEKLVEKLSAIYPPGADASFFKAGPGCQDCISIVKGVVEQSGYKGRVPIFELFVVDNNISDMINRSCSKVEIMQEAKKLGMTTLAQEALIRVYAGYTDLQSVLGYISAPSY